MLQLNIAQQCVNTVASVPNCAFVAVMIAGVLPRHLHRHMYKRTGTSSQFLGSQHSEKSSSFCEWFKRFTQQLHAMQMQPVMQPIGRTIVRDGSR